MSRTRLSAVLIVILLLSSACNKPQETSAPPATPPAGPKLVIGSFSRAIDYSPLYVVRHFRWLESSPALKGVTVEYREFDSRPAISSAFDGGSLDVLFAAEAPIIICRAQGNDVRLIANSCTLQQEIVVRSDLPINSVPDLRGRSVAVLAGTSSHYGLLKILQQAGLSPTSVTIENMTPPKRRRHLPHETLTRGQYGRHSSKSNKSLMPAGSLLVATL